LFAASQRLSFALPPLSLPTFLLFILRPSSARAHSATPNSQPDTTASGSPPVSFELKLEHQFSFFLLPTSAPLFGIFNQSRNEKIFTPKWPIVFLADLFTQSNSIALPLWLAAFNNSLQLDNKREAQTRLPPNSISFSAIVFHFGCSQFVSFKSAANFANSIRPSNRALLLGREKLALVYWPLLGAFACHLRASTIKPYRAGLSCASCTRSFAVRAPLTLFARPQCGREKQGKTSTNKMAPNWAPTEPADHPLPARKQEI